MRVLHGGGLPGGPRRHAAGATDILGAIAEPTSTSSAYEPAEPGTVRIRRALLSVSDKRGIVDFARGLSELGVELVSTGGAARELEDAGLDVRAVEDLTGFPEIMDGRVKTLHPKLYAGLLAVRSDPEHLAAAREHDVEWVDLVCVNLYPFERTAARRGVSEDEVIENIDIGGPTMIRAAAKNHAFAAVVVSPESYDAVLDELREAGGVLSLPTRRWLAAEAFSYTARYDTAISRWFSEGGEDFPGLLVRAFERVTELPYGENPHQRAAYYAQVGARRHVLSQARQHHGKQISYNNILDLDAARRILDDLGERPACVIVKHNNPCGVAVAGDALDAYARALACDPLSAFGGVVALNRPVDVATAEALSQQFVEVLFAPGYEPGALDVLQRKPNVRLLEDEERRRAPLSEPDVRPVTGGLLVQDRDGVALDRDRMTVATSRVPSEEEWLDLLFAWTVCRHVKSNAIVIAKGGATVGIGAGQMSRVDSVRIAAEKARSDLRGAALASDAFFPFADGPALAIEAGVTAIIQPGGSVRDDEVVAAAEDAGVAMVMTGRRHFRH
ncbi:MAG TPA: bifunctional phosphoribosylaminoimidazolecarboxamide formyltransferase/IMP cyclohydrolase [Solirubrobacteraceae bacterium]|nr:bifunctional phosphoribosylaminoimidazolecarboxamide formyltransferase/IMP cyclohydrolase [Solirubrobacteraceae bacterium]